MGTPNAAQWSYRFRDDLMWRINHVDPRITRCLDMLKPQTTISRSSIDRQASMYARRMVRTLGSLGFLQRVPVLDAEYLGNDGEDANRSDAIEDMQHLIGDYVSIRKLLRRGHFTNFWSPVAFFKVGMPSIGGLRSSSISELTVDAFEMIARSRDDLEVVDDDEVRRLGLSPSMATELPAEFSQKSTRDADVLPRPNTSLDIPWVEWVHPFHVVTERSVDSEESMRYIFHITVMPIEKFKADARFTNKDEICRAASFTSGGSEGKENKSTWMFTNDIMMTFDIPTSKMFVILAEVWIREDPDDPTSVHMRGVLDPVSMMWAVEPTQNNLMTFPWIIQVADEAVPSIWRGSSYIEGAYDDMIQAARSRRKLDKHIDLYGNQKTLVPEGMQFSAEEWSKFIDPDYSGPVRYSGNRDATTPSIVPIQPGVAQYATFIEDSFTRNTGVTSTAQGHGSSNKVATAFNQEGSYYNDRVNEFRLRVYESYRKIMLVCTFMLQRYMQTSYEVTRGGVKYTFARDSIGGIINYRLEVVDTSGVPPLERALMTLQTAERVLGNPNLAQHFDMRELAIKIAREMGWGTRVIASGDGGAGQQTQSQMQIGGDGNLAGARVAGGSAADSARNIRSATLRR